MGIQKIYTPSGVDYDPDIRVEWILSLQHVLSQRASSAASLYRCDYLTWDARGPQSSYARNAADYQSLLDRRWYYEQSCKFMLHPVIMPAVRLSPPADWHRLVLEHPHVAVTDPTRIAYTRSDRDGLADRQLITTAGKYLRRHFPYLPDHIIRDLTAQYAAPYDYKLVHTMGEMLGYLHRGPGSCMVWDSEEDGITCSDGVVRHPYHVYDPALGWRLAVRIDRGNVDGRALVYEDGDEKCFVRTYKRGESYSYADEALYSWLVDQGYTKLDGYPYGTKLRYYPVKNRWGEVAPLAPFIDGNSRNVNVDEGQRLLTIVHNGSWLCDNTDGTPSNCSTDDDEDYAHCEDCEDRVHYDNTVSVGYGGNRTVCNGCCENNYFYVYGRRGEEYYVHEEDAVEVNGTHYDSHFLSDNNIVQLEDGEFEHIDNAICIDGEWYHTDDHRIVYCDDDGEYHIRDEGCWQCDESNNWYSDDVTCIELCTLDGDYTKIHEDYIDRYEADITIDETLNIEGV